MTIADDIRAVLIGNAPLMAALTGGVHAGVKEISRQETPEAFDENKELKPCALIKIGTEVPRGPFNRSGMVVVLIYFYQKNGNAVIESAMDQVYDLLHETKIGSKTWQILHSDTLHSYELAERKDQVIGGQMGLMRFVQMRNK